MTRNTHHVRGGGILIAALLGAILASAAQASNLPVVTVATSSNCASNPEIIEALQGFYSLVAADPDSEWMNMRQRWALLPLSPDSVRISTNDSLCAAARAAYNREIPADSTYGPMAVVLLGNRRAVIAEPADWGLATGSAWHLVFDTNFTRVIDRFSR